jgi:Fe-S cluster assembly protein SufD
MTSDPAVMAMQQAFVAGADAGREPEWLARRRASAMQRFVDLGLPTRKDEAWRFTNLRPLVTSRGLPMPAPDATIDTVRLAAHRLPGVAHRIVLVNGRVQPELSRIGALPPGVWLGSVADAVDQRPDLIEAAFDAGDTLGAQPFASLNAAFFTDGFVLALDPGVVLEYPVEVLHFGDALEPRAYHVRSAILAGAGSGASVVETHVSIGAGWTNAVTNIDLGAGALLSHVKVQAEDGDAVHFALTRARIAQAARYESFALITGARLSRQDIQVEMLGEAASLELNGVYLLRGEQEATIAPLVDHQAPGGQTSELLKGVLADRAHGVFLGTVMVREGADRTDARQLNRNIMTSPTARVDTKPELTIYADEVKCSHGATVGDLDDAALFYLQSRGVDPVTARHMLIEAFATEVFEVAALAPDVDAHARRYLHAWLDRDESRS